jgi:hypothetical protein
MKKIITAILGSPKSSILGLASAVTAFLIYKHVITVEESVLILAILGFALGLISKDADVTGTGSNNATDIGGGTVGTPR